MSNLLTKRYKMQPKSKFTSIRVCLCMCGEGIGTRIIACTKKNILNNFYLLVAEDCNDFQNLISQETQTF